jgi:integrase
VHGGRRSARALLAAFVDERRSQLLALRWADIDLDHGEIAVTRALVEGPGGPELRPTNTRRTYRVALDADTATVVGDPTTALRSETAPRSPIQT